MLALGKKRSVIREIFEYSAVHRAEIGADKVFDYSLGNPSIPAPAIVNETICRLISELDPVQLHGYTSAAGDMGVRRTLAANIASRFGFPADAELMYMTCGAAASLTITLKAICNHNDEIIIPTPCFPEYRVFVENAGAVPRFVPCEDGSFQLDLENIEKAINKRTRAVIINSPNNPTGAVFTRQSLEKLAALLTKKCTEFGTDITIIADEPYRELVYGDIQVPYIPCIYDNTVVCYSYSKSLSLPGERIGYILVSPRMKGAAKVYAAVCGAGRSLGYVCAPSLLQRVVAECDGTPPELSAYRQNRDLLYGALTEIGYEAVRPDGAFYLFVRALEPDANAFFDRAKKYELLPVPSDDFGTPGWVRLAYCVDKKMIERSLPAFRALYREYEVMKNDRA